MTRSLPSHPSTDGGAAAARLPLAPDASACVIAAPAELDIISGALLGARVRDALAEGARRLVLDFAGVDSIDSAAIGMLLSLERRAHGAGADLLIANPSQHVRRVFAVTGVARAVRLLPSAQ